jgi:hypothetical protein
MRDDTIPGGEHIRQIGPHLLIDRDRAPDTQGGPGLSRQGRLGADADHDQDHVGKAGHGRAVGRGGLDLQPSRLACRSAGDRLHDGGG